MINEAPPAPIVQRMKQDPLAELQERARLFSEFSKWRDKNGLIKPRADFTDSGNGILYTSISIALRRILSPGAKLKAFCLMSWDAINSCQIEPGLYARTPVASYGQESWDDLMGLAVAAIFTERTSEPRAILWHLVKHGGFYPTTGSFNWGSYIIRFPQLTVMLTIAAFPKFKKIVYPAAWIVMKTMNPKTALGPGALQLQFVYMIGMSYAYEYPSWKFVNDWISDGGERLFATLNQYYDVSHPITDNILFLFNKKR